MDAGAESANQHLQRSAGMGQHHAWDTKHAGSGRLRGGQIQTYVGTLGQDAPVRNAGDIRRGAFASAGLGERAKRTPRAPCTTTNAVPDATAMGPPLAFGQAIDHEPS